MFKYQFVLMGPDHANAIVARQGELFTITLHVAIIQVRALMAKYRTVGGDWPPNMALIFDAVGRERWRQPFEDAPQPAVKTPA